MICEHPCQVKHYCPPFLQMILLPVGPDGSTSLANCMSFLCARAGQDMSSPSKWFWVCDSRPWPGLMQELCSLSPWECHHLSGSFLALDIFCPSSQCKVLKQWMRKGVVAIGWYGQPDKCCPIRDSVPYLLFDLFFRWLKTIEIKRYLCDAEASIPSSGGTEPHRYIKPQWQSVGWIL